MSYSFSVRGPTKAEVIEKAKAKLDEVVASQPAHVADRAQALAAVEAFLEIVPAAEGKEFSVSVNGSVGWTGEIGSAEHVITGAGVGVSVSLVPAA